MAVLIREYAILGQNDKASEDGLALPELRACQNVRFLGGPRRRRGMAAVAAAASDARCMDFDAASTEYVTVPIDIPLWTMGTKFTIEVCVKPDIVTGTRVVFYAGGTTPAMALDTASSNWRWRVWDSGGTLTTVTVGAATADALTRIQLIRDGAGLTTRLDNVAGGTGTMSATNTLRPPVGALLIGYDGTNLYDGEIDYLRGFALVKADHNDALIRFGNPRADFVMFDYDFNADANGVVFDRSLHENHGEAQNTPTEATSLCHNPSPIRAIAAGTTWTGYKRVLVIAGAIPYIVPVS